MNIPKSLDNPPIAESVIEIRFESNLPSDAIFGVFHNVLKELLPKVEKLPVLQIPEHIRSNDPRLSYSALYSLSNEEWILNIGTKVISLMPKIEYPGWKIFFTFAQTVFNKIDETHSVQRIMRLGLRYVNFFNNEQIFDKLNLQLTIPFKDESIAKNITFYQQDDQLTSKITVGDNAQLTKNESVVKGSIIDIDTFIENDFNSFQDIEGIFKKSHTVVKHHFFCLLSQSFIEELGANYD
jgi:uncharacterized protein (TIGR04255 family)